MLDDETKPFTQSNLSQKQKQLDLLMQELDVIDQEKILINQRIDTIKEFLKQLPSTDSQYVIYEDQVEIDRIALDEIITRQESLSDKIKEINNQ
ncbi:MAG: hypothetical protein HZB76_06275 [Chlamydiae bacterium]|nr:hypothetical protein [Chlamydiota bacterium]